jgi:YVTN family beta-propeller protein
VALSWQASAATNYCRLLMNDVVLADNLPTFTESYPVKPSSQSVYTIQAVDNQRHVRDSRSLLPPIQIGSVKTLKGVGNGPSGVTTATGALGTFAYVADNYGNNVTIVDAKLDQVVKTIDAKNMSAITTVNTPKGPLVCATVYNNTILVIDANTNAVKGSIQTKWMPEGIAGGMVGGKPMAYFTSEEGGNIVAVDLTAMTQIGYGLGGLGGPIRAAMGATPDGTQYLYAGPGQVWAIDPVDLKQVAAVDGFSSFLTGIAVAETGSATKVYVASFYDTNLLVIDASTNKPLRRLPFGNGVLTYSKPDQVLYFESGGQVQAVDVNTDTLAGKPIPVPTDGSYATAIAVTADGTKLYVTDRNNQLHIVTYPQAWTQPVSSAVSLVM